MAYAESIKQTGYVVKETTFGQVPAFGNNNAFRFINLTLLHERGIITRPDKTGSYSKTAGVPGNKSASGSMSCSLAGSGAAGTAPDIGPFLEALLGKVTVNAGVSVVYECDDVNPSLSIMSRDKPSTVDQLIAMGVIIPQARFSIGPEIPTVEFTLLSKWVLQSLLFGSTDTEGKGGLGAFPAEPGAPVTNGIPPRGRSGVITLDGNTYTTFRAGNIIVAANRQFPEFPDWGGSYPGAPLSGGRTVSIDSLALYDDDSANLTALKGKALAGTPVDISIQIGTVAGNIWTFLLKNIILPMPKYGWDDLRRGLVFENVEANATSITSKDEFKITLT